ncbi:hypothetical protein HIM_03886 [Hirsutella minnesotensis 3608]|uniref:HTH APSES-type domain-containing protein n=1 Tax=Hirsutella minnesotensis 3608 TaxID=1043627 RepID=A0A0F7ZQ33_9HYPO|nr:hypothetical protein HIM_03886 [Hirsutella minnesotensis 3608]
MLAPEGLPGYDAHQEDFDAEILLQAMRQGSQHPADNFAGVDSFLCQSGAKSPWILSEASSQSTRDILFDRPGLVYMVIRQQAVSMRTADFQINVSQIFKAAKVEKASQDYCRNALKQRCVIYRPTSRGDAWVPFRDGVFVCQKVGFDDELMPLLLHAQLPIPDRQDNYLFRQGSARELGGEQAGDYASLEYGDGVVAYRPSERLINITQILKTGGVKLSELPKLLAKNPGIMRKICRGRASIRGTYISYEDALIACAQFDLDAGSLKRLLGPATAPDCIPRVVRGGTKEAASRGRRVVDGGSDGSSSLRAWEVPDGLDHQSAPQPGELNSAARNYSEPNYEHGSYLPPVSRSPLPLPNTKRLSWNIDLAGLSDIGPQVDDGGEEFAIEGNY